jgi:Terpene cyclase DEP1
MVSLIVHAVIAIAVLVAVVASNSHIFRQPVTGPKVSALEVVYYTAGIAATGIGYYCNVRYMNEYAVGTPNPIWGEHGSWREFIELNYANWAASSASSDYYIMSLVVLPVFTIVDGRRRGIRRSWAYNLFSLTASCTFAWGFYLATVERQRRLTTPLLKEPQLTDPSVR